MTEVLRSFWVGKALAAAGLGAFEYAPDENRISFDATAWETFARLRRWTKCEEHRQIMATELVPLIAHVDRDAWEESILGALPGSPGFNLEIQFDAPPIHANVNFRGAAILEENGERVVRGIVSLVRRDPAHFDTDEIRISASSAEVAVPESAWQQLADLLDSDVVLLDSFGQIQWLNKAACLRRDALRGDWIGREWLDFAAEWDKPQERLNESLRVLQDGQPRLGSLESYRWNDEEWWVLVDRFAWQADGTMAVLIVSTDVTALKRAAGRIADHETWTNLAEKLGEMGTFDWDLREGVGRFSGDYTRILNLPENLSPEVVRGIWSERLHPDDRDRATRVLEQALAAGGGYSNDYRILLPDGSHRHVLSRGFVECDSDGTARRLTGAIVDVTRQRQTEDRLRDISAHARLLAETAGDILSLVALDGRLLYVSPAATRVLGYDEVEIAAMGMWSAIHPLDADAARQSFLRSLSGEATRTEFRFLNKQGETVWLETTAEPAFSQTGDLSHLVCVSRDVTVRHRMDEQLQRTSELAIANARLAEEIAERKNRERELEESQSFIKRLTETLPCSLYVYSTSEKRVVFVNRPIGELGYPAKDVIALGTQFLREIIDPEEFETLAVEHEAAWQGLKDGGVYTRNIRVKSASGEWRWLETREAVFSHTPDGNVDLVIGLARDTTREVAAGVERERVDEALRQSESRLRSLVETTGEWVWESDAQGRFTYTNGRVQDILGYSTEEILGRTVWDFVSSVSIEDLPRPPFDRDIAAGGFSRVEITFVTRQGGLRVLECSGAPIIDALGRLCGFRGMDRDITDRKVAEQDRRHLESELAHVARLSTLGEMTAGLAHELNQPLAAISFYLDGSLAHLRDSGDKPAAALETAITEAVRLTLRCGEIIRRLRGLVTKREPRRQQVDLRDVVREVLALLGHDLQLAEIRIMESLGQTAAWVMADSIQLQQVVLNLLRNALESLKTCDVQRRKIYVRIGEGNVGQVRLDVEDTGPGIPPEVADRLFEPFFSTKTTGLGMGLKISRSIAIEHGGQLTFHSERGLGCTCTLTLPKVHPTTP